jgi:phosphoribosyl 1,2-cyclic phosphodiesterase
MSDQFIRYAVLGSGSKANAYIVGNHRTAFLVDQGYHYKDFLPRLQQAGFAPHSIRYIFLTHEHSDHIKGVIPLAEALRIPIITHKEQQLSTSVHRWDILPGRYYCHDDFSFIAFPTSHDAPNSISYHVEISGYRLTWITDTGRILPGMADYAQDSDVLFLESNYSPTLLEQSHYPPFLKARISGIKGHLSNQQAAQFLESVRFKRIKQLYLCHLSENSNTPETAAQEINAIFQLPSWATICPRDQRMPTQVLQPHTAQLSAMAPAALVHSATF